VVLLKNDGLLPLRPGLRIAVVGLLADEVKLDWYSGSLLRRVSPLEGLRDHPAVAGVTFAEGTDTVRLRTGDGWVRVPEAPDAAAGGGDGLALDPALLAGRTDLPPLTVTGDEAGATELALADWGGGVLTLRAPDGRYLSVAGDGRLRASAEQPGGWVVQETFTLEPHGGGHLLRHRGTGNHVVVAADGLKVAARNEEGAVFTLETVRSGEDAVRDAAAAADAVVVVAGNDPHINGRETEDRATLALPPQQDRLWRAAHAANPAAVLVLTSSYPYAVGDADAALPALLWTAHGGQAAGTALARVLLGDVSPAGRLPQTWYARDEDLPDLRDYDLISSRLTYLYHDGRPLYPFGHGLSYTSFAYAGLTATADEAAGTLAVEVTVGNTGAIAGDEVVQVYARAVAPGRPRPHRALVAHRRVTLAPGEARRLAFTVPLQEALGFHDVALGRVRIEPGAYEVAAGASSGDLRATAAVTLTGEPGAPRPVLDAGLAADAYDEAAGAVLADRTTTAGDVVAWAGRTADDAAVLLYRDCDLGDGGPLEVTLLAARLLPGEAVVELAAADGGPAVTLRVPATKDRYAYTAATAAWDAPGGVRDLRLTLRGPVRVDRLEFTRRA
jgi:beta-glucosidase